MNFSYQGSQALTIKYERNKRYMEITKKGIESKLT